MLGVAEPVRIDMMMVGANMSDGQVSDSLGTGITPRYISLSLYLLDPGSDMAPITHLVFEHHQRLHDSWCWR